MYMWTHICICGLTYVYVDSHICICGLTYVYVDSHMYMWTHSCICELTYTSHDLHVDQLSIDEVIVVISCCGLVPCAVSKMAVLGDAEVAATVVGVVSGVVAGTISLDGSSEEE